MYLLEVHYSITKNLTGKLAKWLHVHTEQVLTSPGFKQARMYKDDPQVNSQEKITWIVQFEVDTEANLKSFFSSLWPEILKQAGIEFAGALGIESKTIDRVQILKPPVAESGLSMSDFPKLHCPFIRQTFDIDIQQWKKYGKELQVREPKVYLVVNRINPGYEWVFDDKDTIAVEKLHGTNVKVSFEQGRIVAIQNRKNLIDPLQVSKGQSFILEAILNSAGRDLVPSNGEYAGEVIGPKLQNNPYKLDVHEWYNFERSITELRYKSFEEHERTFENWSSWFKDHLHSRLFLKRARKQGSEEKVFAEGVIFYNLRRKAEKKTWMAKLRRDMFPWYYEPIAIPDYTPQGRETAEDQEQFE